MRMPPLDDWEYCVHTYYFCDTTVIHPTLFKGQYTIRLCNELMICDVFLGSFVRARNLCTFAWLLGTRRKSEFVGKQCSWWEFLETLARCITPRFAPPVPLADAVTLSVEI